MARWGFKNYNKFLVRLGSGVFWDDMYVHRYESRSTPLVSFPTEAKAVKYLKTYPELEKDFDAWVVDLDEHFPRDCPFDPTPRFSRLRRQATNKESLHVQSTHSQ